MYEIGANYAANLGNKPYYLVLRRGGPVADNMKNVEFHSLTPFSDEVSAHGILMKSRFNSNSLSEGDTKGLYEMFEEAIPSTRELEDMTYAEIVRLNLFEDKPVAWGRYEYIGYGHRLSINQAGTNSIRVDFAITDTLEGDKLVEAISRFMEKQKYSLYIDESGFRKSTARMDDDFVSIGKIFMVRVI